MFRKLWTFLSTLAEVKYYDEILTLAQWMRAKNLTGTSIFLKIKDKERIFKITDSSVHPSQSTENIRFIFCEPGGLATARHAIEQYVGGIERWYRIFGAFRFEIWEGKERHSPSLLRWGLTSDEQQTALSMVRSSAEEELESEGKDRSTPSHLRQRIVHSHAFNEPVTACIAVWIKGDIRGSRIVHRETLFEALTVAAKSTVRDHRFKPISLEEIKEARFEVVVVSDLRMPLTKHDLQRNLINPSQAYRIELKDQDAWYFPEVFNCNGERFNRLDQLLSRLGGKAGIPRTRLPEARAFACDVIDFIEGAKHSTSLVMSGPMPIIAYEGIHDLAGLASRCTHQLARIQDEDGALPAVMDPLTGAVVKQFGWSQQSCTGWALVLFGMTSGDDTVLEAGVKALKYFRQYVYDYPTLPILHQVSSLTYYGRAMVLLGAHDEVAKARSLIMQVPPQDLHYMPITFANLASFLGETALGDPEVERRALQYAEAVQKDFSQKIEQKQALALAQYPELMHAYYQFARWSIVPHCTQNLGRMIDWYLKQQLEDGSFPMQAGRANIANPRGTGKMFEVFSLFYDDHKELLHRTARWLSHMQYTNESAYFIPLKARDTTLGGLRHDYLNTQMWIDGSAHLLIGASRCISAAHHEDALSPPRMPAVADWRV